MGRLGLRFGVKAKRVGVRSRAPAGRAEGIRSPKDTSVLWQGYEVFCLASGPSLNEKDAEIVKEWRRGSENRRVIVTNTTVRLAPWADVLAAMDRKWWQEYGEEVAAFPGERISVAPDLPSRLKVTRLAGRHFGNSGTMAVALALYRGATSVYLLGYDCQKAGDKVHWHGDHPRPLGNGGSMPKWRMLFENLNRALCMREGVKVVNASRSTALTCFERQPLEKVCGIDR